MAGAVGRSAQLKMPAVLKDPIEDDLGKIRVVEDPPPGMQGLVGREEHRAVMQAALVDDMEEHIGRIGSIAEVAHLVNDQDVRMGVSRQGVAEAALARGRREVINERRRRGEARLETILDRAVGNGDGEVRLPVHWARWR